RGRFRAPFSRRVARISPFSGARDSRCRRPRRGASPPSFPKRVNNFMAIINQATKELQVKIVYYGPGKGGKTTNLEQVHANVQVPDSSAKGKMTSLATS